MCHDRASDEHQRQHFLKSKLSLLLPHTHYHFGCHSLAFLTQTEVLRAYKVTTRGLPFYISGHSFTCPYICAKTPLQARTPRHGGIKLFSRGLLQYHINQRRRVHRDCTQIQPPKLAFPFRSLTCCSIRSSSWMLCSVVPASLYLRPR